MEKGFFLEHILKTMRQAKKKGVSARGGTGLEGLIVLVGMYLN